MRFIISLIIIFFIFLAGCSEKEQKEFADQMIKEAINQKIKDLNPIKFPGKNTTSTTGEKCDPSYDEKFSCDYATSGYAVVKVTCVNGAKQKTILGPSYEYCNDYGEYTREYCDSYNLKEIKTELNTVCLAQNTQVGKTYCKAGQIKRSITACDSDSSCVLKDGLAQCMKIPKQTPQNPLNACARDYRGRCPNNCVEYFGECVYPP